MIKKITNKLCSMLMATAFVATSGVITGARAETVQSSNSAQTVSNAQSTPQNQPTQKKTSIVGDIVGGLLVTAILATVIVLIIKSPPPPPPEEKKKVTIIYS